MLIKYVQWLSIEYQMWSRDGAGLNQLLTKLQLQLEKNRDQLQLSCRNQITSNRKLLLNQLVIFTGSNTVVIVHLGMPVTPAKTAKTTVPDSVSQKHLQHSVSANWERQETGKY